MITRLHTGDLVSRAVLHNGIVYVSGLTAIDKTKDLEAQTREVLARIDQILAEAGSNRRSILSALVLLADFEGKNRVNELWKAWLPPGSAPARAALAAELGEGVLIEIMVQAAC